MKFGLNLGEKDKKFGGDIITPIKETLQIGILVSLSPIKNNFKYGSVFKIPLLPSQCGIFFELFY